MLCTVLRVTASDSAESRTSLTAQRLLIKVVPLALLNCPKEMRSCSCLVVVLGSVVQAAILASLYLTGFLRSGPDHRSLARSAMDSEFESITFPPTQKHTHTIVFLHGRGDNARDFAASLAWSPNSQGKALPSLLPSFRWVFPQAKRIQCASPPHEVWEQWFDVFNTQNFADREELQAVGLRVSVDGIRKILAKEASILDGRWDRIILAGISQGAATGVHTLFNLNLNDEDNQKDDDDHGKPRGLGAFLGFSCRCPFPGRSLAETRKILDLENVPDHDKVLRHTPILLEHCADDPLIMISYGQGLRDSLRGLGTQVTWREYPSGGHWFNAPMGIDDVISFIDQSVLQKYAAESKGEQQPDAMGVA